MKKLIKYLLLTCALFLTFGCGKEDNGLVKVEENENVLNYKIVEGNESMIEIDGVKYVETDEVMNEVKIDMGEKGIMIIELYPNDAPKTVAHFQKFVSERFYDGLIFHRVIKNFMIQGGDPTGTGYGDDSVETVFGEFDANGFHNKIKHERGVISMARRGGNPDTSETMNSASSQFFICHKTYPSLDGMYAAFGRVTHGIEVVDKIANVLTDDYDRPKYEQRIISIRFVKEVK